MRWGGRSLRAEVVKMCMEKYKDKIAMVDGQEEKEREAVRVACEE